MGQEAAARSLALQSGGQFFTAFAMSCSLNEPPP